MKTQMLVMNASPHAENSRTCRMLRSLIADRAPAAEVRITHLAHEAHPGITAAYASAVLRPGSETADELDRSEAWIEALERADALVILTPIHNLTAPAALKLWIDNIVRNERTFRSGPGGKAGLLRDRPTIVVITSGGTHLGPHMSQKDYLSPWLAEVLGIVGIQSVEFVHLQGTARNAEAVEAEEREAEGKLAAWLALHAGG